MNASRDLLRYRLIRDILFELAYANLLMGREETLYAVIFALRWISAETCSLNFSKMSLPAKSSVRLVFLLINGNQKKRLEEYHKRT